MKFNVVDFLYIESLCFLLGGLHENGKYENCTGGITGYIDRVIFTDDHLYKYPTCQTVYGREKLSFEECKKINLSF